MAGEINFPYSIAPKSELTLMDIICLLSVGYYSKSGKPRFANKIASSVRSVKESKY